MDVVTAAEQRFATKKYDPQRRIDEVTLAKIETLLRTAPSSVNSQPWHYVIAGTDTGRELIAQAADAKFAMNSEKLRRASHVVVFCVRDDLDEAYLDTLLKAEEQAGRFADTSARDAMAKGRRFFVDLYRPRLTEWMARQVYLALGFTMMGVASLGVDSTPIEGIDFEVLDQKLNLRDQGLRSLVVLSLGYHSDDDFNAALPKGRLATEKVITHC